LGGTSLCNPYRPEITRSGGLPPHRGRTRAGGADSLLSQGTRFLLLLLLVAAEAALFYLFLRRADLVDYPVDRMAISFGGYGAVLVASAWLALRPLYLPDRPLLRGALVVVGLTLPVVLALMPEVPGGLQITDDRQLRHGLFCFADGALVAAAVLVFGRLLDRGDGPGTVLAAVAAGAAGTLLLHVHCPSTTRSTCSSATPRWPSSPSPPVTCSIDAAPRISC
jgi:hypothetical protein